MDSQLASAIIDQNHSSMGWQPRGSHESRDSDGNDRIKQRFRDGNATLAASGREEAGQGEWLVIITRPRCPSLTIAIPKSLRSPKQFHLWPYAVPIHRFVNRYTRPPIQSSVVPSWSPRRLLPAPPHRSNLQLAACTAISSQFIVSQRPDSDSQPATEPPTSAGASILILVTMVMVGSRI